MLNKIEKQIILFTDAYGVEKAEIAHGTLFVKFYDTNIQEHFRKSLKEMMQSCIDKDTGVNANVVGDEYAYDFVPLADEKPWNTSETTCSLVDTYINQQEGK